jgi:UDP-2,4-diacetamido-2,4,6-trideoxy-beta-L-altropyranose hydrolase
MVNNNIFFVVNADENIGNGHFIRTLALAEEFIQNHYQVCVITNSTFVLEKCKGKKYNCYHVDKNDAGYESSFRRILEEHPVAVIVFDLIEEQLKSHSFVANYDNLLKVSLTIFHYTHKRFEDICIYPGLDRIKDNIFKEDTHQKIPYYSGPEFLIFRDEFEKLEEKQIRSFANKILITMGGSDPGHFTIKVLDSIGLLPMPIHCDIVLGKNYKDKEDIYQKHRETENFTFHEDIGNLSELMLENDIAIINGGTTRYELSLVGTPYIAISLHDIQFNITEILAQKDACVNLGVGSHLTNAEIAKAITHLLNNFELRKNINKNMKPLFDLNGKHRIFHIINSYSKNRP